MTARQFGNKSAIVIRGNSAAAWCCAQLLTKAGFKPMIEHAARPGVPAIMLSEMALALMRDVFERPDLFFNASRITRRVVKWGRNVEPMAFDHAAVVVSEHELLTELEREPELELEMSPPGEPSGDGGDFTIFASRPLPPETVEHCFGSRIASTARVRLKDARDSSTCWVESLEDGWLFLIPNAPESGWLLSVGCSLDAIPKQSTLIAGRIASMSESMGQFPASPRIVSPLGGPSWLACGTAGIAFDPICGDGTANAIREAILAAAVVRAISTGGNAPELLRHYEARLTIGFQRHLAASLAFYRSGNGGVWWERELELLQQGLDWCAGRLSSHGDFRYRLTGFELSLVPDV